MVIEQGLTVKITEKNIEYYKEKGYEVDTSEILVDIKDLPLQSSYIVFVKCDNCDKIFQKEYKSVSKYKNHYCSKECHKDFHHKIINMDMARIQENNLKNL